MFEKKLPRSCSIAAITPITVPTVFGAVVGLLLKSGDIIKIANQARSTFNNLKEMSNELADQMNSQTSENINFDNPEEVN